MKYSCKVCRKYHHNLQEVEFYAIVLFNTIVTHSTVRSSCISQIEIIMDYRNYNGQKRDVNVLMANSPFKAKFIKTMYDFLIKTSNAVC